MTTAGSPDLSTSGGYQSPFPPVLPQVVSTGSAVLQNPTIVPVFFPNDSLQSQLTTFLQDFIGKSAAWQVVREYGVSGGTVAAPVVLSKAATSMSDTAIQQLLASEISGGALPKAGAGGAVYVVHFPGGVTIDFDSGTSCTNFDGYHNSATMADGSALVYAVIPRCTHSTVADLTAAISHEVAEASTDPGIDTNRTLSAPYGLWILDLGGTEIGDMCENLGDAFVNETGVGVVSRLWSNAAAQARNNPCQPAPTGTPFFAVPILNGEDSVTVNTPPAQTVEDVTMSSGGSQTLPVRLYANGASSPTWSVAAEEFPLPVGSQPGTNVLTLGFVENGDQTTASGSNGTTLHLKISATAIPPQKFTTVRLISTGPTGAGTQTQTLWVAGVHIPN